PTPRAAARRTRVPLEAARRSDSKMARRTDGPARAAIYVRVSDVKQEKDGSSLQTQEERCRAYAEEHGYCVDPGSVYREVHTGTELWERPRLTALRDAVRRDEVDVVVAYAIDRLAR